MFVCERCRALDRAVNLDVVVKPEQHWCESSRISNPSFKTPGRKIWACRARPSEGMDEHNAPMNDWIHKTLWPYAERIIPEDDMSPYDILKGRFCVLGVMSNTLRS